MNTGIGRYHSGEKANTNQYNLRERMKYCFRGNSKILGFRVRRFLPGEKIGDIFVNEVTFDLISGKERDIWIQKHSHFEGSGNQSGRFPS